MSRLITGRGRRRLQGGCDDVRALLVDLHYGESAGSSAVAESAREHARRCPGCGVFVRDLERMGGILGEAGAQLAERMSLPDRAAERGWQGDGLRSGVWALVLAMTTWLVTVLPVWLSGGLQNVSGAGLWLPLATWMAGYGLVYSCLLERAQGGSGFLARHIETVLRGVLGTTVVFVVVSGVLLSMPLLPLEMGGLLRLSPARLLMVLGAPLALLLGAVQALRNDEDAWVDTFLTLAFAAVLVLPCAALISPPWTLWSPVARQVLVLLCVWAAGGVALGEIAAGRRRGPRQARRRLA